MLHVRNLNVGFPSRTGTLPAVRDVSISIAPGEVMALVGESGSGKSLTAMAIMRLLPPQAICNGSILFQEQTLNGAGAANGALSTQPRKSSTATPVDLLTLPSESMRRLRGAQIAMIFQEP